MSTVSGNHKILSKFKEFVGNFNVCHFSFLIDDNGRSDPHVVFIMILCGARFFNW